MADRDLVMVEHSDVLAARCEFCDFWCCHSWIPPHEHGDDDDPETGDCRRYPPAAEGWPHTYEWEGCGEHE